MARKVLHFFSVLVTPFIVSCFKIQLLSLAGVTQLAEHRSMHQKAAGSIPGSRLQV